MKEPLLILAAAILTILSACNRIVLKYDSTKDCANNILQNVEYRDFITASRNLDIKYLAQTAETDTQKKYALALQKLMERQTDSAEILLFEIINNASDTLIRNEARLVIQNMYIMESKWQDVLTIHPEPESPTDIYYSHCKAWSTKPSAAYHFPENGVNLPLSFTKNGQPCVRVEINGKEFKFIIDTGAQFSVLSSRIAKKCNIPAIPIRGIDAKKTFSKPGFVEKISIGSAEIDNIPVMIIDSRNLDIKLFGLFTLMKIDGIIGWPQLAKLRIEFNKASKTLKISRGTKEAINDGNFFYYLQPVVKVSAHNGIPLYMYFDAGKGHTSLFPRGAKKIGAEVAKKGVTVSSMTSPMGGTQVHRKMVQENVGFCINNQFIVFNEIKIEENENPFFDGWMGMDVCQDGIMILDYSKGTFIIKSLQEKAQEE